MSIFIIIGIILLLLLLVSSLSFYYYKILRNILSLFKYDINKKKRLFVFLSIILCLISINFFSVVGIFFLYFILISLVFDLIYLIIRKYIKKEVIKFIFKSYLLPLFLTCIIMIYGVFNIRNIIETKYVLYTDKNISKDIRILYISDSHYGELLNKGRLDDVKNRLDKVNADIVILGGDIVDESTTKEDMEYIFKVFGDINNKFGIYFVYGNHDRQLYSSNSKYSTEELDSAIISNGIVILNDNYIELENNITLIGRNDYSLDRMSISNIIEDVDKNNYLITVDHQPIRYQENIDNDIDLIVSGHTHAGQLFPVELFIKLFKTSDFSYGYKNFDGMDAIVSSGIVGWGYPIRTSKHSEYVIIDIKEK